MSRYIHPIILAGIPLLSIQVLLNKEIATPPLDRQQTRPTIREEMDFITGYGYGLLHGGGFCPSEPIRERCLLSNFDVKRSDWMIANDFYPNECDSGSVTPAFVNGWIYGQRKVSESHRSN